MKSVIPYICAFLLLAPTSFAADSTPKEPDFQTFASKDYAFSFDYPAGWYRFENVNTVFKAQGMKPVLNVCLTPGPLKTLSCQVDVYVIPEKDFAPPKEDKFYGLPATVQKTEAGAAWKVFTVPQGSAPEDMLVNDYQVKNHFVLSLVPARRAAAADAAVVPDRGCAKQGRGEIAATPDKRALAASAVPGSGVFLRRQALHTKYNDKLLRNLKNTPDPGSAFALARSLVRGGDSFKFRRSTHLYMYYEK